MLDINDTEFCNLSVPGGRPAVAIAIIGDLARKRFPDAATSYCQVLGFDFVYKY